MSEFFSVNTSANLVLDDGSVSLSTGWSSQRITDKINLMMQLVASKHDLNDVKVELLDKINTLQTHVGQGGGSGLEYKEANIIVHLDANETKNYDYLLTDNTFLITNLYFQSSGGNFSFQIVNKETNGFVMYDIESITNYMDSLFLTYNDNDFQKKLRMVFTNKSNFETNVTVSIFGMTLKNS